VLVAHAAGFLEKSDLRGRAPAGEPFEQWPELRHLRDAARVACADVAEMHQAAVRFVLEAERYRWISARAEGDVQAAERLERQARLAQLAETRLQFMAAELNARIDAAGSGGRSQAALIPRVDRGGDPREAAIASEGVEVRITL
jgi:hypothetical protein